MPEIPEDPSDEGATRWGLLMPFVCCASVGGPYHDEAFVAGVQIGTLDQMLAERAGHGGPTPQPVLLYATLEEQADLVAMRHGFVADVVGRDDGWITVAFIHGGGHDGHVCGPGTCGLAGPIE